MISIQKNIPTEIFGVLEQGGYSLHIKGRAGTGKTTLALEIVKNMSQRGTAIYLSTRVSTERILAQFPWVRDCLEEQNILDAKKSYVTSDVPQNVLFEYSNQPEFLRAINAKIYKSEQRPVTVIIDSLDALKSSLNIPERDTTLESILLEIGERTSSNMLFITETDEPCRLDYLTDGVVRLEREILNGRLVRKLYLEKIRGGQIDQPYYLFTLKDSRFSSFEPRLFPRLKYSAKKLTVKQRKELIPTSIDELDRVLYGGLRKGTLNLIKLSRNIVGTEYVYLIYPILHSFVQRGFPVFVIPPQSGTTRLFMNYVTSIMGVRREESIISALQKYFYFFRFENSGEKTVWNEIHVSKESIEDFSKVFKETVTETTKKLGAETFLWFLGVDTMERCYGAENFSKSVGDLVLEIGNLDGICVVLAKHGVKSLDTLTHLASTHFTMDNIGAPVVYGEFPKTKIYAIVIKKSNGANRIDLVDIE